MTISSVPRKHKCYLTKPKRVRFEHSFNMDIDLRGIYLYISSKDRPILKNLRNSKYMYIHKHREFMIILTIQLER